MQPTNDRLPQRVRAAGNPAGTMGRRNGNGSPHGNGSQAIRLPSHMRQAATTIWETELFILRGEDRDELRRRVDALKDWIDSHGDAVLKDLAATLNMELPPGGRRLAIVAGSVDELKQRLTRAADRLADPNCQHIDDAAGIYYQEQPLYKKGCLAALFPGEGAQYLGMVGDLAEHFPEVAEAFAWGDALQPDTDGRPSFSSRFIYVPKDLSPEERAARLRDLGQLDATMCSVLTADLAIGCLLESLNLRPDMVAGHSAGELAALKAAGCITTEGGLDQVPGMLDALQSGDRHGADGESVLLAIGASRQAISDVIAEVAATLPPGGNSHIFLAMDNCPHQTVLVCSRDLAEAVEVELRARRMMHERLPFGRPYHTHLFEPYLGPLAAIFANVPFQASSIPVYSCTTASPFPADPSAIRDLAVRHWAAPVEFTGMIRRMHADGARIFVEVGPRGNLTSFVSDILRGADILAVAANVQRRSGITQLNHMAAQLAAHHVPMDLGHFYRRRDPRHVDWDGSRAAETTHDTARHARQQPAEAGAVGSRRANPSSTGGETDQRREPHAPSQGQSPMPGSPGHSSNRGAVVQRYWEVMETFLRDQEQVMDAYLRRRRGGSRGAAPGAGRSPAPAARPPGTQPSFSPRPASDTPPTAPAALVGEVLSQKPGSEIIMRRTFDLAEDLYASEHTVGGREVSKVAPEQHGIPVVPMTFDLEMMAEAAALLFPELTVLGLRDVQIQRWLAFENERFDVQVTARRIERPADDPDPLATTFVRVELRDLSTGGDQGGVGVATGTVFLGTQYPEPPLAIREPLGGDHPSTISVELLYRNLFHGPSFQGVYALDTIGDRGVDSRIRVQPRDRLFRSTQQPRFLIDPVTVDIGMHPAGAWHLEQPDQSGRIFLPYEVKRVSFYGPSPPPGTEYFCRSVVLKMSPRQCVHEGDMFDAEGRCWCRLERVKSWRFYMPFAEVNFHGPKDEYFLTRDWPEALPAGGVDLPADYQPLFGGKTAPRESTAWCVRLDPTPDLLAPGMQPAAVCVALSYDEQKQFRQLDANAFERAIWLFERVSAKDAVRILWNCRHGERLFPADIEIDLDQYGRPVARPRGAERPDDYPAVAMAYNADTFAAVAAFDALVGVAIEPLAGAAERAHEFCEPAELAILADWPGDDAEKGACVLSGKAAIRSALGSSLVDSLRRITLRSADAGSQTLRMGLDGELAALYQEFQGRLITVRTTRHNEAVVGTTLCQTEQD